MTKPLLKVVIVEGDEDIRDTMLELVGNEGHQPIAFGEGGQALSALESGLFPDLIISDYMMPAMTGIQLRHHLLKSEKPKAVPFYLMSARVFTEEEKKAFQLAGSLKKPFAIEDLQKILEHYHG